jgi:multicomponent K+:H+ antiporter subunit E
MTSTQKKWLPQPLISAMLFLIWLALNNTIHPAHILLGACLALAIPWWTSRLAATTQMSVPRIKRPLAIAVLFIIVLIDIVKSNITVAKLILGKEANIRPAFVWVPLAITDPYGKVALAGIITMTPGTLSADFSDDGQHLLVHAFNVDDQDELIADIKARYELPLMEIFQ